MSSSFKHVEWSEVPADTKERLEGRLAAKKTGATPAAPTSEHPPPKKPPR